MYKTDWQPTISKSITSLNTSQKFAINGLFFFPFSTIINYFRSNTNSFNLVCFFPVSPVKMLTPPLAWTDNSYDTEVEFSF